MIPEEQFWKMTPRKLHLLTRVHGKLNNPDEEKKEAPRGYIDQVIF